MKRITLAWALTLCSFITFIACSSPDVGERSVSIIPAPAQMTVGEGTFTIHPGIEIGYADESLKGMGELLSNEIEKLSGIKLASASDKESNCIIFLELTDPKEFADLPKAYGLSPKDSVPVDESYSLSIQKRNIYIKATTLEGIYRGITTLKPTTRRREDLSTATGSEGRTSFRLARTLFRCISLLLRSRGSETSDRYSRLI